MYIQYVYVIPPPLQVHIFSLKMVRVYACMYAWSIYFWLRECVCMYVCMCICFIVVIDIYISSRCCLK